MNSQLGSAKIAEAFHLAFLQVLGRRLDQARFVVKGGANLRFFFGSVRYSEDIDLDLVHGKPWGLTEKVNDLLSSQALGTVLRSADLAVVDFTAPKQTETTQRWK